jgi:peroxiredoxin
MNKLILAVLCYFTTAPIHAQVTCTIKGQVAIGHPAKRALIGYENEGKYETDTATIKEGRFEFKSSASRPALAQITLLAPPPTEKPVRRKDEESEEQNGQKNIALFYLEGTIRVQFDSAGIATVSGGGIEEKSYKAFIAFGRENEKKGKDALPFDKMITGFITKYPDAYISLDLMEMFAGVIQPATFEPMYMALSPRLRNTRKAKTWKIRLEEAKKLDVGRKSLNFTLNDVHDNPVSLTSFRGRYVLLDFWASWCGPCRAANPELKKIYNKFKSDGFDILAVSLDDKKQAWLKAIQEDKLPWRQVSDLKGSESEVAKMYNITQIPQNLLINPEGIIVGRNLTGKNLEDKLSDLLN